MGPAKRHRLAGDSGCLCLPCRWLRSSLRGFVLDRLTRRSDREARHQPPGGQEWQHVDRDHALNDVGHERTEDGRREPDGHHRGPGDADKEKHGRARESDDPEDETEPTQHRAELKCDVVSGRDAENRAEEFHIGLGSVLRNVAGEAVWACPEDRDAILSRGGD